MAEQTVAGTQIAISAGQPATEDAIGYGALTYTTIYGITSIGPKGPSVEQVDYTLIEQRTTKSLKGSIDYGTQEITYVDDPDDAGQIALTNGTVGAEIDTVHSVKLTLKDGTIRYYQVLIMSNPDQYGESNAVNTKTTGLRVITNEVVV